MYRLAEEILYRFIAYLCLFKWKELPIQGISAQQKWSNTVQKRPSSHVIVRLLYYLSSMLCTIVLFRLDCSRPDIPLVDAVRLEKVGGCLTSADSTLLLEITLCSKSLRIIIIVTDKHSL